MVVLLALLVGLAVGAVVAWQLARSRAGEAFKPELARLDAERQAAVDRARALEESDERVKALASEALRQNNASFLDLARTQLTPIAETLKRFDEKAQALDRERQRAYGSLMRQVQTLGESQERLRVETGNLRTALRAPHVRGRWGEIQLRRVVELAGMLPHCDFQEQTSVADADGRLLRPDLVVNLPGGKHVVIDAKAPLAAYLDALDADDETARRTHLHGHARQVREHIGKLGQKRYWEQFDPSPEFVIMFLPDETFFRVACEVDASLLEVGPESGVLPASPTTLIGLLKTLAYAWQQETVAQDAREIAGLGRELYDRLGTFADHFGKVGRALETAVGTYNKAVGSLESRVLVTARKFEEHGAATGELPEVQPLERTPRPLTAAELTQRPELPAADAA